MPKFKVTLQVTLYVEKTLEDYDLEEDNLKGQGAIDAIQDELEQELTDQGYSYFISEYNNEETEDNHHKIEYLSET